jgi:hypothetical protein
LPDTINFARHYQSSANSDRGQFPLLSPHQHFQVFVVVLALLSRAQSTPTKRARDNEPYDIEPPPKRVISSSSKNVLKPFKEVIDNSVNFRGIAEVVIPRIEEWFAEIPIHPGFSTITNSSSIFTTIAGYVVESKRGISPIAAFISSSNESVTTIEVETPALEAEVKFKLCYRASEHDFLASEFHRLCDGKGATITVVKDNTGKMAAAYNGKRWNRVFEIALNPHGFLASIDEAHEESGGYVLQKFVPGSRYTGTASYSRHGPSFGSDLHISDRCNENTFSRSIITPQGGYVREGMAGREHLFRTFAFRVSEYEVFQVELQAST